MTAKPAPTRTRSPLLSTTDELRRRCAVLNDLPWQGRVYRQGETVDLPEKAISRHVERGLVAVLPVLAPRPTRPEPRARMPLPWATVEPVDARPQCPPSRTRERRRPWLPRWSARPAP